MSRNNDNLLGLGGGRGVSRSNAKGAKSGPTGPSDDARRRKEDLLRKIKERNQGDDGAAGAEATDGE
ncbi:MULTISPECIES: DUF6243 family protein [Nocardiopsis]|uniref:DUF6243 family protein n=1 Tax=Nocardiopsis lambiniae TaxID=3075539 RepID=A0ABU2MAQ7_9ACTN|nr:MULTISPECIES: DUF6243 family protein [unclassified Nocardiopsis]MDE3723473.1 DUF6243 family protein [Nocardiopsis sp. N85]MDT0329768.1 DUF6243 family protein [Nocardiopsis sp. DSM 44743]